MQKALDMEKLTLNFHLKKLFSSALIDHYFKRELGNPAYSFYAITPLGSRVLTSLNHTLIPTVPLQKTRDNEVTATKLEN